MRRLDLDTRFHFSLVLSLSSYPLSRLPRRSSSPLMTSDSSSHLQQAHSRACTRAIEQRRFVSSLFIIKYIYIHQNACARLSETCPIRLVAITRPPLINSLLDGASLLPLRDAASTRSLPAGCRRPPKFIFPSLPPPSSSSSSPFAPSLLRLTSGILYTITFFTLYCCAVHPRQHCSPPVHPSSCSAQLHLRLPSSNHHSLLQASTSPLISFIVKDAGYEPEIGLSGATRQEERWQPRRSVSQPSTRKTGQGYTMLPIRSLPPLWQIRICSATNVTARQGRYGKTVQSISTVTYAARGLASLTVSI